MSGKTGRRDFLKGLVGGLVAGAVVGVAGTELYRGIAAPPPPAVKESVPTTPIKAGIQAYLTGGGAIWGKPMMQGAVLAIEEINERGGILGRKIEYVVKPETSPEETVREYRTLVLDEKIDFYVGLISSSNTPAVGPVGCRSSS
ncbi:MAG: ABC transporter substrate-binding protein [Nitrososphaerota archaeon]